MSQSRRAGTVGVRVRSYESRSGGSLDGSLDILELVALDDYGWAIGDVESVAGVVGEVVVDCVEEAAGDLWRAARCAVDVVAL